MRNPLKRQPSADPKPTLRERAAALKATTGRVMNPSKSLPAPGSDEAREAFAEACREHARQTQFARTDYPDLMRSPTECWTKRSLGRARELGEVSVAEYARLYPRASEREMRTDAVSHRLNVGVLHALAYTNDAPMPPDSDTEDAAEDNDDAELLRLGRLFEAARIRDRAACDTLNEAEETAGKCEPARPACLTYRTSDHSLSVYGWYTHPSALEGIEIGGDDVARLRQKMPMKHVVLRATREGERAHIDYPGKRHDTVAHPEAQARAEEIVTAWDAWQAERTRIHAEHVTPEMEAVANEAWDATARFADEIAGIPAHTAAGFRVKLRALCHFDPASWMRTSLPEYPDPDQRLYFSLRQDAEREANDDAAEPASAEEWASVGFEAYNLDTPVRSPREWIDRIAPYTIGLHLGDRFLRMQKPESIAAIEALDSRGPEAVVQTLNAVRDTAEEMKALAAIMGAAYARLLVAGSSIVASADVKEA